MYFTAGLIASGQKSATHVAAIAPVIKGINVNGDGYKLDYGSVKNAPVCLRKTAGSVILPVTTVDFYENLPPA